MATREFKRSTVLSNTKLSKKEKNFYAKQVCPYCGLEIGLHEPMYYIKGQAFHDICEINHLLDKHYKKGGDKNE